MASCPSWGPLMRDEPPPPDSRPNSFVPSGDQIGRLAVTYGPLSVTGCDPSGSDTTKLPKPAGEMRTYATFAPSGDQVGHDSSSAHEALPAGPRPLAARAPRRLQDDPQRRREARAGAAVGAGRGRPAGPPAPPLRRGRARGPAGPAAARRRDDLPGRRPAGEDRPRLDGPLARGPRAVRRRPGARVRRDHPRRPAGARAAEEVAAAPGAPPAAAARGGRRAQARLLDAGGALAAPRRPRAGARRPLPRRRPPPGRVRPGGGRRSREGPPRRARRTSPARCGASWCSRCGTSGCCAADSRPCRRSHEGLGRPHRAGPRAGASARSSRACGPPATRSRSPRATTPRRCSWPSCTASSTS